MKSARIVFSKDEVDNSGEEKLLTAVKTEKNVSGKSQEKVLEKLVEKTNRRLFKATGIFPFDFFPDDIIVDTENVSLIIRQFPGAEYIRVISIADIEDIMIEATPFFATVKLVVKGAKDNPIAVRYLRKNDARESRRIIAGVKRVLDEGIDIEKALQNEERGAEKIEMIGQIATA